MNEVRAKQRELSLQCHVCECESVVSVPSVHMSKPLQHDIDHVNCFVQKVRFFSYLLSST